MVRELVATGLSRPTAERFVERALSEPPPASAGPPSKAAGDSGGRGALVSGAFWFSFGSTITGVTFLLASTGQTYVIAYGAVLAGLLAFGRGFKRWWETSQPFPWKAVFMAVAVPPRPRWRWWRLSRGASTVGRRHVGPMRPGASRRRERSRRRCEPHRNGRPTTRRAPSATPSAWPAPSNGSRIRLTR